MDSAADAVWARPINGQHVAVDSSSQEASMQSNQTLTGSARCRRGHVKDSHYASQSLLAVTLEPPGPNPVIGHDTSTVDCRTQHLLCQSDKYRRTERSHACHRLRAIVDGQCSCADSFAGRPMRTWVQS